AGASESAFRLAWIIRRGHDAAEHNGQLSCNLMHNPAESRQAIVGQPAG
ncbi:unnamed protein product, partial [marine sediment metagenome]